MTSAHELFVEHGYAATTMEAIAARAGVAVQTVYYTFRTKGQLLREVVEHAGAGRPDAPPVDERPWMREALSDESGDRALALAVEHGVDIYVRAAPLWRSLHAAAISDPEVEAYVQAIAAGRRAGMGGLVARLGSLGYLREGITANRATDLVFALFSHETFLALTRDAQWTTADYKAWLYSTLRWQLSGATDAGRDALRSLSYESHVW
ncbi:MAG TPA: helix-turn-helix domain-containing protein [Frankiaceae bacterium]|nr:helix-turn-helix domain-containing protein [Frankiaceae bacterium]